MNLQNVQVPGYKIQRPSPEKNNSFESSFVSETRTVWPSSANFPLNAHQIVHTIYSISRSAADDSIRPHSTVVTPLQERQAAGHRSLRILQRLFLGRKPFPLLTTSHLLDHIQLVLTPIPRAPHWLIASILLDFPSVRLRTALSFLHHAPSSTRVCTQGACVMRPEPRLSGVQVHPPRPPSVGTLLLSIAVMMLVPLIPITHSLSRVMEA